MNEILHNQFVIGSGIALAIAVAGVFLTRNKLYGWGLALSKILNSKIGTKATQWLEDKMQQFLDGMKSDNEGKK